MTDIHSTAVVAAGAEIGEGACIGPYCVVGPEVQIGPGTRLMPHVCLDGWTRIGAECTIFPFASIGTRTQDLKFRGGRPGVRIGDRTTLREYVTVNAGTEDGEITEVGSGCLIMASAHVAHACRVGDGVIMGNATMLAGHVLVEDAAVISALIGVHQFCRIGRMSMVGGLSRVTQDVPPFVLVEGIPAAPHGLNTVGLGRRGVSDEAQRALKQAYKILYRSGLGLREAIERIRADVPSAPEVAHFLAFLEGSERGIIR